MYANKMSKDVKTRLIMPPLKTKIPVTLALQGFEMAAEQGFELRNHENHIEINI